mmetsp:Transcript_10744/g.25296  ORF Transcript_10744/g.25296 Transcript_10744/m.25296 type:complete len:403 (-) Transcript_10744:433-1641(-)
MGQAAGSHAAQLEERFFRQKVKLGQGSFGTVWRAVDRQTGDTVAIKQVDKAAMLHRGMPTQQVQQEIDLMQVCKHRNIIQLLATYEDNTSIFLALEYCDGGDFGDKLRELGLAVSEREVADWVRQMCHAVGVLHERSICHRDVKPDNFMVHQRTTLKLADLGLATVIRKGLLQGACGTPAFNAPEQHPSSAGGYSFPVDMWAVGVSMYMVMFGGKHPFLDERQNFSEKLMLQAKLDFRDRSSATGFLGLEGLGVGLRFSEEAQQFCRRLVEADPLHRISAHEAVLTPWLRSSSAPVAPRPAEPRQHPVARVPKSPNLRPSASRGHFEPSPVVPAPSLQCPPRSLSLPRCHCVGETPLAPRLGRVPTPARPGARTPPRTMGAIALNGARAATPAKPPRAPAGR